MNLVIKTGVLKAGNLEKLQDEKEEEEERQEA